MVWHSPVAFYNKNGASKNETAQENFYNTLTQGYKEDYGQFQGLTKSLLGNIQPIVDAGPDQYGFAPAEDASLRSTAQNADAVASQNAEVAANKQIVAANGGSAAIPTGAEEELKQQADISGAQKLASDEQKITQAGYQQGAQNWSTALGQEDKVLGAQDPNSFAASATAGGQAATGAVNAETNANDSWMTSTLGALGGAAGTVFAGAGTKLL